MPKRTEKTRPRTLVVGDIHGGYAALKQVLKRASVTPADTLIFLGDYVDGWSASAALISWLISLSQRQSCLFLKGNHDIWCEHWLATCEIPTSWMANGGASTMLSYESVSLQKRQEHLAFFQAMSFWHRDAQNRLFVHAGFTDMYGAEKESHKEVLLWDRTLWEMALCMRPRLGQDNPAYPQRLKNYAEIYLGHTPVLRYGVTTPLHRANVWNMDTGAGFTGPLTIMDIHTKTFWQSDPLPLLYPLEKGRN